MIFYIFYIFIFSLFLAFEYYRWTAAGRSPAAGVGAPLRGAPDPAAPRSLSPPNLPPIRNQVKGVKNH